MRGALGFDEVGLSSRLSTVKSLASSTASAESVSCLLVGRKLDPARFTT